MDGTLEENELEERIFSHIQHYLGKKSASGNYRWKSDGWKTRSKYRFGFKRLKIGIYERMMKGLLPSLLYIGKC